MLNIHNDNIELAKALYGIFNHSITVNKFLSIAKDFEGIAQKDFADNLLETLKANSKRTSEDSIVYCINKLKNQKGEIQPIGGATDKIEGFFQVCKARKLDGTQGVVIPYQNVKNLHLCDEVIAAVKEGKFHIWPVKTIDEGIEILTGVPAGKKDKFGHFPSGTINYLVYEKLKKYAEISKE